MLEVIKNFSEDVRSELEKYCDEVTLTGTGNVIGLIRGSSEGNDSIMLAVHTDKPRFICTGLNGDGTASLSLIGSLKVGGSVSAELISDSGIPALLVCGGTDDKPTYTAELGSADAVVAVGDTFRVSRPLISLAGETVAGFGLSVTAPAAALMDCAKCLSVDKPRRDIYFVFTAEGQYDYRLYASAAREAAASSAVCIGAVDSSDAKFGECAVVRLCDKSFSSDKPLSDALITCGAVPTVLASGSCAASRVQLEGIPSAQLDLPVKYAGTLCELVCLSDIKRLSEVLTAFGKN